MLKLFFYISAFTLSVFSFTTNAKSPFVGAWWVVNSPLVSVITEVNESKIIKTECDAEQYFSDATCKKTNSAVYLLNSEGTKACSVATEKHPACWFMISPSRLDKNILFLNADPTNSRPGLGYAYSYKRLFNGQWPMRN